MKTNRLISIALVTVMALTVVSGAGVMTATKGAAVLGYDEALENTLPWTATFATTQGERFSSSAEASTNWKLFDEDGVLLSVAEYGSPSTSTDTPGANEAILTTTVTGPGTLTWLWGLVSDSIDYENNIPPTASQFAFEVDGSPVPEVPPLTINDGGESAYTIDTAGTHTLSWKVTINPESQLASGQILGVLETVAWTPSVTEGSVIGEVNALITTLNGDTPFFQTPKQERVFVNKLNGLIAVIDAGDVANYGYAEALAKVSDDLMKYNTKWGVSGDTTVADALAKIAADLEELQGTSTVVTRDVYLARGNTVRDKVGTATFDTANGAWSIKTTTSIDPTAQYAFSVSDAAPVGVIFTEAAFIHFVTPDSSGIIDQSGPLDAQSTLATINQYITNGGVFLLREPQG